MKTRKVPYTAEELSRIIISKIDLPKILDYYHAKGGDRLIDTYNFDFCSNLIPGNSEGIYLDIGIFLRGERFDIATFKTLETSQEAFEKMGTLLGDFIFKGYDFVLCNFDDFDFCDMAGCN